jgi:hypothetical protein
MACDPRLWTQLSLGDRVRLVRMPNFEGPQHPGTLAVYEWLLATGHIMTIEKLDWTEGVRYPWSDAITYPRGYSESYDWLMLNHDGLELAD